jgi:hypothetical protein
MLSQKGFLVLWGEIGKIMNILNIHVDVSAMP